MPSIELHIDSQLKAAIEALEQAESKRPDIMSPDYRYENATPVYAKITELTKEVDRLTLAKLAQIAGKPVGVLSYSSNNSGGSWWLSDGDWKAMEAAGWVCHFDRMNHYGPLYKQLHKSTAADRWLGALCTSAALVTDDPDGAVREWEFLTGSNAGAEGCNCCGNPHDFEFTKPDGTTSYGGIEVTSTFTGF